MSFFADISLIIQKFSDLENSDLKNGEINVKKNLKELPKAHRFFGKG